MRGTREFTAIRNVFNEMYAKDTSKKIRATWQSKGRSGEHLTTIPPYGYKKDPENKKRWIVDEEAAAVVQKIFALCMDGMGPTPNCTTGEKNFIFLEPFCNLHNICNGRSLAKNYIVSDDLVRIRVKDANLRAYLLAYFTSATALSLMLLDEYGSVQQHLQPRHIQEMLIPVPDDWSLAKDMIDAGNMFIKAMEDMSKADKKIRTQGFDDLIKEYKMD